MCVIVYKPGKTTIDRRDLWNMWCQNSDGAGFAYLGLKDDGTSGWFYEKGFMKFKHLKRRLRLFDEYELVLHFRHATHGLTNQEMCHPFPVLPADNDIHTKLEGQADVLFHNGVLGKFGDKVISDTFDFTTSVLTKLDLEARKKTLESVSSKFILCYDDTMFVSGYFTDFKGLKVSNTNFDHVNTHTTTVGFNYSRWHKDTFVKKTEPSLVSHSAGGMLPYAYANDYDDYHAYHPEERIVVDSNLKEEEIKAEEEKMWAEFRARNRYNFDDC